MSCVKATESLSCNIMSLDSMVKILSRACRRHGYLIDENTRANISSCHAKFANTCKSILMVFHSKLVIQMQDVCDSNYFTYVVEMHKVMDSIMEAVP